jgi:hypothetical protein
MDQLDAFMELWVQSDEIELIGIGAAVRGGNEWFQGLGPVREIIESDWTYWGDVTIDVTGAKITVHGEAAWLSTHGELEQTDTFDQAMPFYLAQMKEFLENEELSPDERFMEATHFGMRRIRERAKGVGHHWPFVLTAMLMHTSAGWRFHTIHWSMPVD